MTATTKTIVLGVTGSIAAYKAAELVRRTSASLAENCDHLGREVDTFLAKIMAA